MAIKDVKKFPIGGVHLPEKKGLTNDQAVRVMPDPAVVNIPLSQHIGAPAEPIVEAGDIVKKGECIAELQGKISARVHSSINGVVKGIVERKKPGQGIYKCISIEKDDSDAAAEKKIEVDRSTLPEVEIIRKRVEAAGVIGMGGAGFPTHVKLTPPDDMEIDTVIINGAECEPFLTVDHRLLLEEGEDLFRGLEMIKKAVGAERGIVAIEVNKQDAIDKLHELAKDWPGIEVQALDTRYPHGAEKHLIKAVLNREVPKGELPMAVNVVVNNVQTAIKIARAVDFEEAVTDRVLTISGEALKTPSNVKVPIGSSIKDVIEFCGGPKNKENYQIIVGGPMTGINIDDESIPITKGTSGIVLITAEEFAASETRPCIRCGRCSEVCPMYLAPNRITAFINNDLIERAVDVGLMDCIECGACAYICPSKRPLVRWLKRGKAEHRADDK
ncbi:MAG: electron transport complex subunit RsxC [Halanaerobium sp.]